MKVDRVIESIKIESQQLDLYEGKEKEGFLPRQYKTPLAKQCRGL